MSKEVERIVNADRVEDLIAVFGSFDENVRRIEEALGVRIVSRGDDLKVTGDEEMADKAVRTLEALLQLCEAWQKHAFAVGFTTAVRLLTK